MSALRFLRIITLVIFDVIALSVLSIVWHILLYLNLPPNWFMFEEAYVVNVELT